MTQIFVEKLLLVWKRDSVPLWSPNVHRHIQNIKPVNVYPNTAHTFTPCFSETHFNIILPGVFFPEKCHRFFYFRLTFFSLFNRPILHSAAVKACVLDILYVNILLLLHFSAKE
jgi:hypothetical protein